MPILKPKNTEEKVPIIRMVLLTSLPSFLVAETFFAILYLSVIQIFGWIFGLVAMLNAGTLDANMQIFNPANIVIFLLAIATMSVVMFLEILTIIAITTYDYYRNDHIPFKELLKFSYEKLENFLKIKSAPFFLFIFLFPKAQIAPQTIFALNIPAFITDELVKFPLYFVVIIAMIIAVFYFVYRSIFVLHYLFLERTTISRAFRSSFALTKKIGIRKMFFIFFKNIFWIFLFIIPIIAIGIAFARAITLIEPIVGNGIWWLSDAINTLFEFLFIGLTGAIFLAGLTITYIRHSGYKKQHFESRFHFLKDYPHFEPRWKNLRNFFKKKYLAITTIILIILSPLFLSVIVKTNTASISDPMIISHRGESTGRFMENSLSGIVEAKNLGADMVEIDIYENADGTLILSHDANLKRITGINKKISELTDADLETIILPNGEKIPKLEDVLQIANMRNISLLIEPKLHGNEKNLIETLVKNLEKYDMVANVAVHSFDLELLKNIKKRQPHIKTGLIIFGGLGHFGATEVDFFSLQERLVTRANVRDIHQNEKKIFVWTVNNSLPVETYMRLGVDGIITDKVTEIASHSQKIVTRYASGPQVVFRIFRMEFSYDDITTWWQKFTKKSEN